MAHYPRSVGLSCYRPLHVNFPFCTQGICCHMMKILLYVYIIIIIILFTIMVSVNVYIFEITLQDFHKYHFLEEHTEYLFRSLEEMLDTKRVCCNILTIFLVVSVVPCSTVMNKRYSIDCRALQQITVF